jgi:hypothetical protein
MEAFAASYIFKLNAQCDVTYISPLHTLVPMTGPFTDPEMNFDTIVIEVDGRLTHVPHKLFASSSVFQDMFSMPQNPDVGAVPDGSDNAHPLVLEGIKYEDYRAFVRTANAIEWVLSLVTIAQPIIS